MSAWNEADARARIRALEDEVERLRLAEGTFRSMIERLPARVALLDTEGRVLYMSQLPDGRSQADVVGRRYVELVERTFRSALETSLKLASDGGERVEGTMVDADGRSYRSVCIPMMEDERRTGTLVVVTDISRQREIEMRLVESESRYRSVVENFPDYVTAVDRRGRITFLNRAGPGFTPESVIGRHYSELVPPETLDVVRDAVERALTKGEVVTYETGILTNDRVYANRVAPIFRDDQVVSAIILSADVTDQRRAQERLRLADRLASMGTLAAGLAHEINNPLTYVMVNLRYSLRKLAEAGQALPPGLADVTAALEESLEGVGRASRIVQDLRAFSHGDGDEGDEEEVDLRPVLESSVRMASNEIRHRARLVQDIAELPPVRGNASRLGQVFLNLLVNAAQALPDGAARQHEIRLSGYVQGEDRVVVEVRDTGPGISDNVRSRLFDPFFTTKRVGEGTGLGLSICHNIVSSIGGTIEVESATGQGSTFRVILPRYERSRPGATEASGARIGRPKSHRILVVDDEPNVRASLARALEGHQVVCAGSGREALEILGTDRGFDLILCDLMMPDVSGMEVYRRLKEICPETTDRLLFMTGGAFTARARKFLEEASVPSLEKPIDLDLVLARLERGFRRG